MKRLKKIRIKGGGVFIQYEREDEGRVETMTLESPDTPKPELRQALQAFAWDLVIYTEAPASWESEIEIRAITLVYTEDGDNRGITISGLRKLKESVSPLVINSPVYWNWTEHGRNVMTRVTKDRITALEQFAFAFVAGDRAQLILSFEAAQ